MGRKNKKSRSSAQGANQGANGRKENGTSSSILPSTEALSNPGGALPVEYSVPHTKNGLVMYERILLLALRDSPFSRLKPKNLPEIISIKDNRSVPLDTNTHSRGLKCKLEEDIRNCSEPNVTKVSIVLDRDVRLTRTENAWKPVRFLKNDTTSVENQKTADLYKKFRSVLNKLTPQKFQTLIEKVRALEINTLERLQGVIDLVFEKAVDEPNFSVAYALMCRELSTIHVRKSEQTSAEETKMVTVNFHKLLITRCQMAFEKSSVDENKRKEKVKEIEDCRDLVKKKELKEELAEDDHKMRLKSIGNIRFIGELFKQNMLTVSIMVRCLNTFIKSKDEESLECLCKLLTTIGQELEAKAQKSANLGDIFKTIQQIVDGKHVKVSSRIRFMLIDIIDLKKNKWVPRREAHKPKMMEEIKKEAESEQLKIEIMNAAPVAQRRRDNIHDNYSGPTSDSRRQKNFQNGGGWKTQTTRNNRVQQQFCIQSEKLKLKPTQIDEPLGSRQMFNIWSKGSAMTKTNNSSLRPVTTSNMYTTSANISKDNSPFGTFGARDARYGPPSSVEKIGNNVVSNPGEASTKATPPVDMVEDRIILTEEQLRRRIENNLAEYLNDNSTVAEYDLETRTSVPVDFLSTLVYEGYMHALERSSLSRAKTGMLFSKLINMGTISLASYCAGLTEVLDQAGDLKIDIPKIWDYLGELLVSNICEMTLPLGSLHKCATVLIGQKNGTKMLEKLFKLVVKEKGSDFLVNIWKASGLSLNDFMPSDQISDFIKYNALGFICQ